MIKACLFDLDGTLLPVDTEGFVHVYLNALAPYVSRVIPPDKLVPAVWQATMTMIRDTRADLRNEEVFEREFLRITGLEKDRIWPLFDRFYAEEFPKLREHCGQDPFARRVVEAALEKGLKVAVATNPVFPESAIRERLRWAGVGDLPVDFVTTFENSRFCKPLPEYYLDVAEKLGVRPEECVMVGNDMQEDMVASTLGMRTFYVDRYRIDRGAPTYEVNQEGSLADLLRSIREGSGVFDLIS
ncbi:HAD family hydrolase [Staphylospora marina]|uniref:HAD family hydrolase n=1 Tax=Staphylospora marina TaxID=2490858 RepID=UPI000F5BBB0C|nr:HAD family hydrolase [Staphylospora marina]